MSYEREHKYLVTDDSYKSMATASSHIRQGYLNRDPDRTVRIRIRDGRGFLTVKGRTVGDTRPEFEYSIPVEEAEAMLCLCAGRVIDKTRWIVPYDGFTWEVDEFHSDLAPLVVAEIELPQNTRDYPLPPFAGENVTGDERYFNSMLQ